MGQFGFEKFIKLVQYLAMIVFAICVYRFDKTIIFAIRNLATSSWRRFLGVRVRFLSFHVQRAQKVVKFVKQYLQFFDKPNLNYNKLCVLFYFVYLFNNNLIHMKNQYLMHIKKHKKINLDNTKYPVIQFVAENMLKWKVSSEDWSILWNDHAISQDFLKSMDRHQKVNHFPGMQELSRKNRLAKNLNNMRKQFEFEYDFYPRTWNLPSEYSELCSYSLAQSNKTYIVKPEAGCQGRGIYLTRDVQSLVGKTGFIVQQYIEEPYLIDKLKFDFRIYVLITSVQPLRIFVYKQGLVRFATQQFLKPNQYNIKNTFAHLTNYAINKQSDKFTSSEYDFTIGHKRSLTSVIKKIDDEELMQNIYDIIIKTVVSGYPELCNQYRLGQSYNNCCCFELLGFDIILTKKLKPILLEVNHTPSFNVDTQLDKQVKTALIYDTLNMMQGPEYIEQQDLYRSKKTQDKMTMMEEKVKLKDNHQNATKGRFVKIYPCQNLEQTERYDQLFNYSQKVYHKKYGTNIIRTKKKIFNPNPNQQQLIFIPKLNMHRDLYKVYNNTSIRPFVKKEIKRETVTRYDDSKNQHSFKQASSVYGRRGISTAGRSTNFY